MSATTIFVGDLSYFCEEKDLLGMFSAFGPVSSVIIRRGKEGNSLQYAFVIMSDADAHAACSALNGRKFMGRKLRMNISTSHQQRCTPLDRSMWFQLHVRFKINTLSIQLNELLLEEIFMAYGPVADVTVKEYNINMDLHTVSGYAFVYYSTVDVANLAIQEVNQNTNFLSDAIHFRCNFAYDVKEGGNKGGFDDFDFAPRGSIHHQQHPNRGSHVSNHKSLYQSSLPTAPPRGYFPEPVSSSAALAEIAYHSGFPFISSSNHLLDSHDRRLAGGMMGSYQNSHSSNAPYAASSYGYHPAQFHQTHHHSSQYVNLHSYPSSLRNMNSNSNLIPGYEFPVAFGKQPAGAASLGIRTSHLQTFQHSLSNDHTTAASSGNLCLSPNANMGLSYPSDVENTFHPLIFSRQNDFFANESDFGSNSSMTTSSVNARGSDSAVHSDPLVFSTHLAEMYTAQLAPHNHASYNNNNNNNSNPLFASSELKNPQKPLLLFPSDNSNMQNDKQHLHSFPLPTPPASFSSPPTADNNP